MTARATAPTDAPAVAGSLGPDSLTWRYFGDYRYLLMLPQAFVLQVAHPVIDAGVGEHSTYRTDPWGRAQRSMDLLWPIVYARPDTAMRMAGELREMHRRIKGTLPDGRRYNALNPEAYGWVHGTGLYTTLKLLEVFEKPASADMQLTLLQEWRTMGQMLGLRHSDLPASMADYRDYFNHMIDTRLERGPVMEDLLSEGFFQRHPKPPAALFGALPEGLWRRAIRPLADAMEVFTRATLPANFRQRFDIHVSAGDEQRVARLVKRVKRLHRLMPASWRYLPLARAALKDARAHPEAYRPSAMDTLS